MMPALEDVHQVEAGETELKEPAGPLYSVQLATLEHDIREDPCPAKALEASQAEPDIIATFTQEQN